MLKKLKCCWARHHRSKPSFTMGGGQIIKTGCPLKTKTVLHNTGKSPNASAPYRPFLNISSLSCITVFCAFNTVQNNVCIIVVDTSLHLSYLVYCHYSNHNPHGAISALYSTVLCCNHYSTVYCPVCRKALAIP